MRKTNRSPTYPQKGVRLETQDQVRTREKRPLKHRMQPLGTGQARPAFRDTRDTGSAVQKPLKSKMHEKNGVFEDLGRDFVDFPNYHHTYTDTDTQP
jgi:hypothetical protein